MKASARRALGAIALVIYLPVYIVLAASVGGLLAGAPSWAAMLFYGCAGLAWVVPLYPLFVWMRGSP